MVLSMYYNNRLLYSMTHLIVNGKFFKKDFEKYFIEVFLRGLGFSYNQELLYRSYGKRCEGNP